MRSSTMRIRRRDPKQAATCLTCSLAEPAMRWLNATVSTSTAPGLPVCEVLPLATWQPCWAGKNKALLDLCHP